MMRASLAVSGLTCKPHVASSGIGHASRMRPKAKKIYWDKIKSPLQKLFVQRLHEEMAKQGLTDNGLAARCKDVGLPIGQSSVSRITGGRQDTSLEVTYALAAALGFANAPWYLLTEADSARREVIRPPEPPPGKVASLPRYPKTFTEPSDHAGKAVSVPAKAHRVKRR